MFTLWAVGSLGVLILLHRAWFGVIYERDFVAAWVAGKLAAAGHATQAYNNEVLQAAGKQIAGTAQIKLAYPYPPQLLFVDVPLSYLPLWMAYLLWQAISAALFYVAARPYFPKGVPSVLAVVTPAALVNVLFGQVGLFFGALWLFAFRGSSFAAAALTFKPHLGMLVGVETVRKKFFLKTCAIAVVLTALSIAAFGMDAWRSWFSGAVLHQVADLTHKPFGVWRYQMVTPYLAYGLFGWLAFAAAAIFLLVRKFDVFTAATASFLIAPYGFHYDMTVVCLGFGLLLFRCWRAMPAWQTLVCALAFLLPELVVLGTWVGAPILLAGLFVQTRNQLEDRSDAPLTAA